ncbi:MAG: hypothetical protein JW724_00800, partial [Candidatus Altiarchaeota archaeon]|nr:hypothetical protein [Candidatus Altiarchaeota archaeon]
MGDPVICTLISLLWIPPAFMALLLAAYVYLSWSREDDLLKKDRKRRHIKYPAILFIASILLIPALSLLTGSGIMNSLCQKSEEEIMPPNCHILNEFSDGSNKKTIDFPEYGSFNSETKITLPRTASVKNASITFKHEPEAEWKYEFNMWGGIASSSGIDLDTLKGCAYIKMKKLEVDSSIVLDGTHSFDEVRVKKGGMITTSPGKNLHLRIKGALTIDEGGMINLDGKSSQGTGKASAKKEVGNFYGSGGGGGGHGGAGGKGGDDKPEVGGSGGAPYGLSENPIEPGSCGANG